MQRAFVGANKEILFLFTWTLVLLLAKACSGLPRVVSILACNKDIREDNFDNATNGDGSRKTFGEVENQEIVDGRLFQSLPLQ